MCKPSETQQRGSEAWCSIYRPEGHALELGSQHMSVGDNSRLRTLALDRFADAFVFGRHGGGVSTIDEDTS